MTDILVQARHRPDVREAVWQLQRKQPDAGHMRTFPQLVESIGPDGDAIFRGVPEPVLPILQERQIPFKVIWRDGPIGFRLSRQRENEAAQVRLIHGRQRIDKSS